MAPKNSAHPIPTGWTFGMQVQKDGSKALRYSCSFTGQQYENYEDLIRYVEYAKKRGLGIYAPGFKALKRAKNEEKDIINTGAIKEFGLSIRRKPPSELHSSTVFYLDSDSASSDASESTDYEKDQDYMPESESESSQSSVSLDLQPSDTDLEVNQVPNSDSEADD